MLDEHCQWAFRYLAERQTDGDLFITTTRRLLDYLRVRDHLSFDVTREKGAMHIALKSIECPIYGAEPALAENVQGITFSITDAPEKVTMSDALGKDIGLDRHSSPRQAIISVPWTRLVYTH